MKLYQIDIKYACFGIESNNNIIVNVAPIAKWTVGKNINHVINYYRNKKNAKINEVK